MKQKRIRMKGRKVTTSGKCEQVRVLTRNYPKYKIFAQIAC